ncbi:sensor histidine kinase [Xanthovirga aplysinae]|uniref:sensor histidine kinase n=1 Tax=Xanthovirga aplysinae TaxID=2529853 RepID=UPI0012BC3572|nr:ATP-binding protein [Xanthovirga aplysinae]MTI33412.1 two-component sensor histidine kinase [Xanthovirga aplysinae]
MWLSSKKVAFLLAVCIALTTTAFLSLLKDVREEALFVAGILSFSSAYILVSYTLELLIFKEINNIYKVLGKLRKKDMSFMDSESSLSTNPIKRINQEIYSYAAVKQKEIDELKRLETFRREFLADVSHELKTPIFSAQGYMHTLLDGADEDEKIRRRFLQKAAKSLDRLDHLVQDLLTISHLESGDLKMNFEAFDLNELFLEIIEQLESKAEKKQIELGFDKDIKNPVMVYADPKRIHQVLLNLITNAINYTQEGGKVVVGYKNEKEGFLIYINDNGPGIPPEDQTRVFERFYRVEKSRSKEKGGTGLGLAIVKHFVEAHNSQVNLESKLGKGTSFSFKLPKAIEEPTDQKPQSDELKKVKS